MSQPAQQFPPWLSPSPVVITDAAGNAVATDTVVQYIPPTYFGPSIPLGSLYIFGGSTEPATIVLPSAAPETITTSAPPSITTATPTSTTPLTTSATPTTSGLSISSTSTAAIPTSTSVSASSSASSVSLSTSSTSSLSLTSSSTSFTSSSSSPFSSSITSSFTSSSSALPSSTTSAAAIQASGLSRGQLVGVIVASILGLVFLFVLALFLFLCLKGRRARRQFTSLSPIDEDYYIVPPGGRAPGEGSPRHSGEEADPFLQRSSGASAGRWGAAATGMGVGAGVGAAVGMGAPAMAQVPSNGASRVPPPPLAATSGSNSSVSTNSNASGFGVLIDRPSLGYLPSMPEHQEVGGVELSPADMARIGRESVLPENADQFQQYADEEGEGAYEGAYAYSADPQVPPRLVGPGASSSAARYSPVMMTTQPSKLSNKSSLGLGDPEEAATLLTARRVRVEDLGPRSTAHIPEEAAGPSTGVGFLGALGLGGLANIGRLSWFKNLDGHSHSSRHSISAPRQDQEQERQDYTTVPLSEKDLETGRGALLHPDTSRRVDSFGQRPRGAAADGLRPISSTSARSGASGATTYHDAQSSLPATPHDVLAPLPRALTPAEHAQPPAYTDMARPAGNPRASNPNLATTMSMDTHASVDSPLGDVLDLPAPSSALTHFSSTSSLKDTPTGSSFGSKMPLFPPPGLGLESTIRPIAWSNSNAYTNTATTDSDTERALSMSMSENTASRGSLAGYASGLHALDYRQGMERVYEPVAIDVLEEEPPDAEMGWRSIWSAAAAAGGVGLGGADPSRRGTFGMFMSAPGSPSFLPAASEQGSLHSMRSHFTPSNRSTGSAPASVRMGSSSSRGGAHSLLLRTGSISSDERRRPSPALSAFGHGNGSGHLMHGSSGTGSGSGSRSGGHEHDYEPVLPPVIGTPPSAHIGPGKPSTLRLVGAGGGGNMHQRERERSISPSNASLSPSTAMDVPWAGGLAGDWQASV